MSKIRRSPDREMLIKLSNVFNVTLDYLVDNNNIKTDDTDLFNLKGDVRFLKKVKDNEMVKIPVLGAIRAGLPLYAHENNNRLRVCTSGGINDGGRSIFPRS